MDKLTRLEKAAVAFFLLSLSCRPLLRRFTRPAISDLGHGLVLCCLISGAKVQGNKSLPLN